MSWENLVLMWMIVMEAYSLCCLSGCKLRSSNVLTGDIAMSGVGIIETLITWWQEMDGNRMCRWHETFSSWNDLKKHMSAMQFIHGDITAKSANEFFLDWISNTSKFNKQIFTLHLNVKVRQPYDFLFQIQTSVIYRSQYVKKWMAFGFQVAFKMLMYGDVLKIS